MSLHKLNKTYNGRQQRKTTLLCAALVACVSFTCSFFLFLNSTLFFLFRFLSAFLFASYAFFVHVCSNREQYNLVFFLCSVRAYQPLKLLFFLYSLASFSSLSIYLLFLFFKFFVPPPSLSFSKCRNLDPNKTRRKKI